MLDREMKVLLPCTQDWQCMLGSQLVATGRPGALGLASVSLKIGSKRCDCLHVLSRYAPNFLALQVEKRTMPSLSAFSKLSQKTHHLSPL